MNSLGYSKNLFILPFDHRSSFAKGLFGKTEEEITGEEKEYIKYCKKIIYFGFKDALKEIPKEEAGILVDEEYGSEILLDAKANGFVSLLTTEKSGQKEFTMQEVDFKEKVARFSPTFLKALVRFHPDDEIDSKERQLIELKKLNGLCLDLNVKFLIEPLIIPKQELNDLEKENYFNNKRPFLEEELICQFHDAGVEPDVWKIEGTKNINGYQGIADVAKKEGRDQVGIVVLGGGQDVQEVEEWIAAGAKVEGIIGFAVGRTVFWQPIVDLKENKDESKAIAKISENFIRFYRVFKNARL
jgi:myo-inositol catabolism protein IolC